MVWQLAVHRKSLIRGRRADRRDHARKGSRREQHSLKYNRSSGGQEKQEFLLIS